MNNFFKNKKNLYILAGAILSLIVLVLFIWIKIASFKESQNKQRSIVTDPKITESTRNREYSEVSRESAAGIFAGRDSLRSDVQPVTEPSPVLSTPDTTTSSTVTNTEKPKGKNNRTNKTNTATAPATASNDTTVKTALEQQMEQMEQVESKTTVVVSQKRVEHKEAPKLPRVNLVVVKDRKPSVYSTYKEDVTTTYDDVVLFSAKVYGMQKIKTNETVTFRNTEPIAAFGHVIAAGSILRGTAKMSGNRMQIDVTSAVSRDGRYSVKMSVYDNDFVKGVFVREVSEISEENTSSAADAAINIATSAIPMGSVVKSAGRETARQTQRALEKQNKITITLEDGYEVYLAIAKK
jgi:hypothetical protein